MDLKIKTLKEPQRLNKVPLELVNKEKLLF